VVINVMKDEPAAVTDTSPLLTSLQRSFQRSLAALNRTPRTRNTYAAALRAFVAFLVANRMPQTAAGVQREHVESFIADVLERRAPTTALTYYASLSVFFR
jgi:hypothetical protein